MQLQHLALSNFRNYSTVHLAIHPQVTHIVGDNAQGKTNLLEAIFFLGRGRSFRTSQCADVIRQGAEAAYIRSSVTHNDLVDELGIEIGSRRRFVRNGKGIRRPDRSWPHMILFAPEETFLFKAAPSMRRDYLDTLIEGMDPAYGEIWAHFARVLRHRNQLLRNAWQEPRAKIVASLAPWTDQLVQWGGQVIAARQRWIGELVGCLPGVYRQFAGIDGDLEVAYLPHVADVVDFSTTLRVREEEEIARGMTVVGPQRDDWRVRLSGRDLHQFGSQGQHRSVVLALKIAELELARRLYDRTPVLLLDDVASELDPTRAQAFFTALERLTGQILLTTTHIDRAVYQPRHSSTVTVRQGAVFASPE